MPLDETARPLFILAFSNRATRKISTHGATNLYAAYHASIKLGVGSRIAIMNTLLHLGLVAFGSALGGMMRYIVGAGSAHVLGVAPHWGTMFINITGSFFLGWFSTMLAEIWTTAEHSWLH